MWVFLEEIQYALRGLAASSSWSVIECLFVDVARRVQKTLGEAENIVYIQGVIATIKFNRKAAESKLFVKRFSPIMIIITINP